MYLPKGGEVGVDLSGASGAFQVEWIHPTDGTSTPANPVAGGDRRILKAPLSELAALYLQKS